MSDNNALHEQRIIGISQARMGSSRLPGKTLTDLAGKNVLEWHLDRVAQSRLITEHIVATSTRPEDEAIAAFCAPRDVGCFRGSSQDVLSRYLSVARDREADVIVRMTGDCPLIDPQLIDLVISHFLESQEPLDYMCLDIRYYLRGFDVEVFSRAALEKVAGLVTCDEEREHVTLGIYRRPEIFKTAFYFDDALSFTEEPERLCVDTQADLQAVKTLIEKMRDNGTSLEWRSIMETMDANPHIARINSHIEQVRV